MHILPLLVACSSEPVAPPALIADVPASDQETAPLGGSIGSEETPEEITGNMLTLDDWELAVLGPRLEEIRAGVQLKGPDGLGICQTDPETKGCLNFMGRDVPVLPVGRFHIQAVVTAPRESTGWKVSFSRQCTLKREDGSLQELRPAAIEREVPWRGGKSQTLRLSSFTAPAKVGERECSYTLVSLRNDGKETGRHTGSYKITGP